MPPALRDLFARFSQLARRRGLLTAALLCALAGMGLTRLPLFEVPGFELATAMGLLVLGLAGGAGIAAARDERRRARERAIPADSGGGLLSGYLAASFFSLLVLVPPFLAAVAGAALGSRCDPFVGAAFYLLLPVPTALLAAAAGLLAGLAFERAWKAALALLLVVLATVVVSVWPLWAGPQLFALNHFVGYFPGPIYDEALSVDGRIVAYRGLTLLWTLLLLGLGATLLDPLTGRLGRPRPTSGRVAAIALAAAGLALGTAFSFELGLGTSHEQLDRALGGRTETAHLVMHYPRAKSREDVQRLERELEYAWATLSDYLGAAPAAKVHAWFYASPEQKRRLVGASHTDYTKPWRAEFHVGDSGFPHRTARHELAHAFGAAFGSPVFGVSARAVVSVNIGLVEGLAVAADDRPTELTLHEWSAAMRKLGLAPPIRSIVEPVGFYGQPASRAYTLAGSFLGFVREHYGAAALRALYPAGDFQSALGKPLAQVAAEWEAFLDALPLGDRALHTAQVRFERGSLFARPCAREVAVLAGEADELSAADPERALGLYQRCSRIEPGNPRFLRAEAELLEQRRDLAGAQRRFEQLLEQAGESVGARAAALMGLGDLAWAQGALPRAKESFEQVLALHRDRATDRTAAVKLEALDDPEAGPVLRSFFDAEGPQLDGLLALDELSDRRPQWATGSYLIGRQLLQRGAPRAALPYLERARSLGPRDPQLALENLRMLGEAAYLAGDCARSRAAFAELSTQGEPSDRRLAADFAGRCDFEQRVYGGPLRSER